MLTQLFMALWLEYYANLFQSVHIQLVDWI